MDNKKFKEEMAKPLNDKMLQKFHEVRLKKTVTKLKKDEIRALFYRALYLDNDEREKFKKYLTVENMTDAEEERYRRILPNHLFNKYFNYGDNR